MHAALVLMAVISALDPVQHFSRVDIDLPGAHGAVALDYLAADRQRDRVWVPARETGSVDVLQVATRKLTRIGGFASGSTGHGGPSSATVGADVAFVGDRGSNQLCAVDADKLVKLGCATLASWPDGVQLVSATHEVWVTTPGDRSITGVDVRVPGQPRPGFRIALPGEPEGYGVDERRGLFFTNLVDANQTAVIDVRSRHVVGRFPLSCGEHGARGLAIDEARQLVFVACTDKVLVLDGAHAGAVLSSLATGAGVDNIDYLAGADNLYVAAGKAGRLTVIHVGKGGALAVLATLSTAAGARTVVVTGDGSAVVTDPHHGRVLLFSPTR